jgi:hypothetical protein
MELVFTPKPVPFRYLPDLQIKNNFAAQADCPFPYKNCPVTGNSLRKIDWR